MPKKKIAKGKGSAFVNEKLSDFAAGSTFPVYSDVVYGYLKSVLDQYYTSQDPKLLPKMIGKVPGDSPFAPSRLAFDYGADEIGLQVEYEYSPNYIVKTTLDVVRGFGLGDPGAGYRVEVRRDVVTGAFSFKNGKIKGSADSIVHGVKEFGGDGREYFRIVDPPNAVSIGSLSALRESGVAFGSHPSSDLPLDALSSLPQSRFLGSGWADSPFVPNLL